MEMSRSLGGVLGSIGALLLAVMLFSSCRIIEDGEVGIVRSFGEIIDEPLDTGVYLSIPLARSIDVWNTKLQEVKETADVPSSEGLIVQMDVSVLWRVVPEKAPDLRQSISGSISDSLVTPYIRNGIRDVASGYAVKAVYTTEGRREIAATLRGYLQSQLRARGVEVEDVILRDLKLPPTFKQSIEAKLAAEQRALQKEFELQQATKDAEIEIERARGAAQAQKIIDATLTEEYLHYRWIETLAQNPNVIYVATEAALPIFKAINGRNGKSR